MKFFALCRIQSFSFIEHSGGYLQSQQNASNISYCHEVSIEHVHRACATEFPGSDIISLGNTVASIIESDIISLGIIFSPRQNFLATEFPVTSARKSKKSNLAARAKNIRHIHRGFRKTVGVHSTTISLSSFGEGHAV